MSGTEEAVVPPLPVQDDRAGAATLEPGAAALVEPGTPVVGADVAPDVASVLDVEVDPAEVPVSTRSERTAADRAHARGLFTELAALPEGDPRRARLRDELVEQHLPLVEYLARLCRNRGEPLVYLVQVATIGLIKSIERFDLKRGVEILSYTTSTIVWEIKLLIRDMVRAIWVSRRHMDI